MTNTNDETAQAVPTAKDTNSLVPSMTKETWELIELRLWNSFSKKLWVILTSVLTIAALAGLLGVDAWVKARVSDALSKEVSSFEQARKDYDARSQRQLVISTALFVMQERLIADSGKYAIEAKRLLDFLTPEQRKSLFLFRPLSILFNPQSIPRTEADAFKQDFEKLAKEHPEIMQESGIGMLGMSGAIKNQYRDYWHLQGLRAAIELARSDLLTTTTEPTRLDKYYEEKLFPRYSAIMNRSGQSSSWAQAGLVSISSLRPTANAESMLLPLK